jgi:hypothetical protein
MVVIVFYRGLFYKAAVAELVDYGALTKGCYQLLLQTGKAPNWPACSFTDICRTHTARKSELIFTTIGTMTLQIVVKISIVIANESQNQ